MKSVLLVALAYFRMAPLQSWGLNTVGAFLLAVSVLFAVFADGPNGAFLAILCGIFGALLLVLLPIFVGAGAMRAASSPMLMHLRPHGRLRMVLGTTLAITLLAAIALVPVLVSEHTKHLMAPNNRPMDIAPLAAFAATWTVVAGAWIAIFVLSRSPFTLFMVGLLPLLVIKAGRLLSGWLPDPALALGIAMPVWMAFATWYLRARAVHRISMQDLQNANNMNAPPLGALQRFLDTLGNLSPRERALRMHLMGTASPWTFALGGLWFVLVIIVVQFVMPEKTRAGAPVPANAGMTIGMAPALAIMCGTFGYSIVRRARQLWLRAGADRAALFGYAERLLMICMLTLLLVAGGAILLMVAGSMPSAIPRLPVYALALVLLGVSGLYTGLANTRGLEVSQILAGAAVLVLGIMQTIELLRPETLSTVTMAVVWLLSIGMALLMRWHARRRWLQLDWRVARLPQGWRAANSQ